MAGIWLGTAILPCKNVTLWLQSCFRIPLTFKIAVSCWGTWGGGKGEEKKKKTKNWENEEMEEGQEKEKEEKKIKRG